MCISFRLNLSIKRIVPRALLAAKTSSSSSSSSMGSGDMVGRCSSIGIHCDSALHRMTEKHSFQILLRTNCLTGVGVVQCLHQILSGL